MLRIALTAAIGLGLTVGMAGAQGVPGAAAVEGYHERFANDSRPDRSQPPASSLLEWQLPGQEPRVYEPGLDESVVMRPVPAPIPDRDAVAPPPGRAGTRDAPRR